MGRALAVFVGGLMCASAVCGQVTQGSATTAWHGGRFEVDATGLVSGSNLVLERPNLLATEAMPLGNGRLGVAVWLADGLTAQLNRGDAMPGRLSAGQLTLPGVAAIGQAKDFHGVLDLARGEFRAEGGGMTIRCWVEAETDALVVEGSGLKPEEEQKAVLRLWSPRKPKATAAEGAGMLAESWVDDRNPGASGRRFGTLAAVTAEGRGVRAEVTDGLTVTVRFRPDVDGHFRVRVAAPHFDGGEDAARAAEAALRSQPEGAHRRWWGAYWQRAGLIRVETADGSGEYLENLRNLYLYVAAVEKGEEFPGTQAGIADMIGSAGDEHRWDPSAFWHFNLRMQVAANLKAGLGELNEPYFRLYRENLERMEKWTRENMGGRAGICVPETMRFNGQGIEYEGSWTPVSIGRDCDEKSQPYYNARTLSTGAEVGLWIWEQYRVTGDRKFLEENYPVMAAAARFLLAYAKPGSDGMLHTSPSNAHENQWDVTDPVGDLAGAKTLYRNTMAAAELLGRDGELQAEVKAALLRIPGLPKVSWEDRKRLVDGGANAILGESYVPGAEIHNIENVGLEPVWPYGLIGVDSPEYGLAVSTFQHRLNVNAVDWSFDPVQAARLGLSEELKGTLLATTKRFQGFTNGMAKWEPTAKEFYVEQTGVVALTLAEALVQDYDGVIRIAPAVPKKWDMAGTVAVRAGMRVDVETRGGQVVEAVLEAGKAGVVRVKNPWPGKAVLVTEANGSAVKTMVCDGVVEFAGKEKGRYRLLPEGAQELPFAAITRSEATKPKRLGAVSLGLFRDGQ